MNYLQLRWSVMHWWENRLSHRSIQIPNPYSISGIEPSIELVIGNDGPHIPESQVEKIFDAFFTSGKKNGTGLGLAIAQKIMHAHGGAIECKSAPGFGVEFCLRIPVA